MARKKSSSTPGWLAGVALLILGLFTFLNQMQLDGVSTVDRPPVQENPFDQSPVPGPGTPTAGDAIRLASFNIQVFGQAKLKNTAVIEKLATVIRQFDLVAIQEIRSVEQNVIPDFLKVVNANGSDYRYLISPRLGRTVSKEQYAYVYRSDRLEPIPGSVFNVDDPKDLLHREPFVASFRTRISGQQPFSFTLINAHTDPDEAEWEVSQLAQVYQFVATFHRNEDDIILLGDLNVDSSKLTSLTRIPQLASIAPVGPTNTRGTRQYDHIVINQLTTQEFTGRAGVLDLAKMFDISMEQALELSDHYPVWAEFSTTESPGSTQLAAPPSDTVVR